MATGFNPLRRLSPPFTSADKSVMIGNFISSQSFSDLSNPEAVASMLIETAKATQDRFPDDDNVGPDDPTKKSNFCKHGRSCQGNCLRGFIRSFGMGFGIKAFISLISGLLLQRLYRKPLQLVKQVFGIDSLRFGAFLGVFTGSYKGIQCLLRFLRGKEDTWNSGIAAAVASFAILLDEKYEVIFTFIILF